MTRTLPAALLLGLCCMGDTCAKQVKYHNYYNTTAQPMAWDPTLAQTLPSGACGATPVVTLSFDHVPQWLNGDVDLAYADVGGLTGSLGPTWNGQFLAFGYVGNTGTAYDAYFWSFCTGTASFFACVTPSNPTWRPFRGCTTSPTCGPDARTKRSRYHRSRRTMAQRLDGMSGPSSSPSSRRMSWTLASGRRAGVRSADRTGSRRDASSLAEAAITAHHRPTGRISISRGAAHADQGDRQSRGTCGSDSLSRLAARLPGSGTCLPPNRGTTLSTVPSTTSSTTTSTTTTTLVGVTLGPGQFESGNCGSQPRNCVTVHGGPLDGTTLCPPVEVMAAGCSFPTMPDYVSVNPFDSPQCDGPFHDCIVKQGHGEAEPVLCPVTEVYQHCQAH